MITRDYVRSLIVHVEFVRVTNTTLTIAILFLRNGFHVIGESSFVNPDEFDEKNGKDLAFENALSKVYDLEGYLVKQRMFEVYQTQMTFNQEDANNGQSQDQTEEATDAQEGVLDAEKIASIEKFREEVQNRGM